MKTAVDCIHLIIFMCNGPTHRITINSPQTTIIIMITSREIYERKVLSGVKVQPYRRRRLIQSI